MKNELYLILILICSLTFLKSNTNKSLKSLANYQKRLSELEEINFSNQNKYKVEDSAKSFLEIGESSTKKKDKKDLNNTESSKQHINKKINDWNKSKIRKSSKIQDELSNNNSYTENETLSITKTITPKSNVEEKTKTSNKNQEVISELNILKAKSNSKLVPDYSINKSTNDPIDKIKSSFKTENKNCELKTEILNYVFQSDLQNRKLMVISARTILKKSTLSVYLDLDENSIRDSIRVEDIIQIVKSFGSKNLCFTMFTNKDPSLNKKSMSLCFDSEDQMNSWVTAIKDMKRCKLSFEIVEMSKLVNDYQLMQFLMEQQQLLNNPGTKPNDGTIDKLQELYYNNDVNAINKAEEIQDKLIDQTLNDLVDKSIEDQMRADNLSKSSNSTVILSQTNSTTNLTITTSNATSTTQINVNYAKVSSKDSSAKSNSTTTLAVANSSTTSSSATTSKRNSQQAHLSSFDLKNSIISDISNFRIQMSSKVCFKSEKSNITEIEYRRSVCNIINQDQSLKENCLVQGKDMFCSNCCQRFSRNNMENCINKCII